MLHSIGLWSLVATAVFNQFSSSFTTRTPWRVPSADQIWVAADEDGWRAKAFPACAAGRRDLRRPHDARLSLQPGRQEC